MGVSRAPALCRQKLHSESPGSLSHAIVQTKKCDSRDGRTGDQERCEMDRIQCANRLLRERLTRAIDDFRTDSQDLPVRGCSRQVRPPVRGLGCRQFFQRQRTQQHSVAFNECQVRGERDFSGAQESPNLRRSRLVQEPCKNGARLGIEIHRGPRSSSSNCAALCRGSRRERGNAGYTSALTEVPNVARPRFTSARNPAGTDVSVCPCPGGNSSATTSPRSVTSTLSPKRTRRRYSLSRFFRSRTPTVIIGNNVAPSGYIVN